jgi:hypothetical protein
MKVDYDSEGRSLLFEFGEFREFEDGDYVEELAGGSCIVWFHKGRADSIQLLDADKDIRSLDEAAERLELDGTGPEGGSPGRTCRPGPRDPHRLWTEAFARGRKQPRQGRLTGPTPRSG